jgi:hypothetical protein
MYGTGNNRLFSRDPGIYQERIRIKSNLAPGLGGVLCGRYFGGTSAKVSLSIYQWKIRILTKKFIY